MTTPAPDTEFPTSCRSDRLETVISSKLLQPKQKQKPKPKSRREREHEREKNAIETNCCKRRTNRELLLSYGYGYGDSGRPSTVVGMGMGFGLRVSEYVENALTVPCISYGAPTLHEESYAFMQLYKLLLLAGSNRGKAQNAPKYPGQSS